MTLVSAGFEVSPSGTAIPLTGGADTFTASGVNGSGTSFVSDSSVAAAVASGTLAGKITIGGTAAKSFRGWAWSGGIVHLRQYVYLTASPNARFTWWENVKSDDYVTRIQINTNRTLRLSDGSNSWTTTAAIPLDTLVRVEASFDHAAGSMSLAMYVGNSATAIAGGTASTTGQTFSSTTLDSVFGGVQSTLTNFTIRTDAWAVSDVSQPGPLVTGGTIAGVTAATATMSAPAGSVLISAPVDIVGVTAQVVAQGGARTIPAAPPSNGPLWPPDPYREAIRSGGYSLTYSISATLHGVPVEGATDLRPVGGSIIDTTKPGVRRTLQAELVPEPGRTFQELYDLVAPNGTQLKVTAAVVYLNRITQLIPMGVYEVDSETLSEGGGGLSLTAPDKWVRIQRAQFLTPTPAFVGMLVVDQIAEFIRGALGAAEPVAVSATSTAVMGALVFEKDREKAIHDLAAGIGAWVFFDRDGVATIADIPSIGASSDWLIDSSASGVLIDLDRQRSRTDTCNVVVVESSAADGAAFPTQVVWDADPASPTYAGTDPRTDPGSAGPFGIVPHFVNTPLPLTAEEAYAMGATELSRKAGLASQASLSSVPNPAVDAFQIIDVLPPRERYDVPRVLERRVIDTVTHSLTGGAQTIECRSTRAESL